MRSFAFSGSVTPFELRQEAARRLDKFDAELDVVADVSRPARLRSAQQAVVDEDAGQLIADGAVHQRAATAESTPPRGAQTPGVADAVADARLSRR